MLLKLLDINKGDYSETEVIECDYYVPFNIIWEGISNNISGYYWRTGSLEQSFLEIGINSKTGFVKSVTLLQSKNNRKVNENLEITYTIEGLPTFDLNNWGDNYYYDYPNEFSLLLYKNGLSLYISDDEVSEVIKSDRLLFHINKNKELSRIDLVNLTFDEIKILVEALKI